MWFFNSKSRCEIEYRIWITSLSIWKPEITGSATTIDHFLIIYVMGSSATSSVEPLASLAFTVLTLSLLTQHSGGLTIPKGIKKLDFLVPCLGGFS